MSNKDVQRKIRKLEIELQQERQAKENLQVDFEHLLYQIKMMKKVEAVTDETAVACG